MMSDTVDTPKKPHTFRRFRDGESMWTSWDDLTEKIFQADRSYKCPTYVHRTPPCQGSCPSGHEIRGWLAIARQMDKPPVAGSDARLVPVVPRITPEIEAMKAEAKRLRDEQAKAMRDAERARTAPDLEAKARQKRICIYRNCRRTKMIRQELSSLFASPNGVVIFNFHVIPPASFEFARNKSDRVEARAQPFNISFDPAPQKLSSFI